MRISDWSSDVCSSDLPSRCRCPDPLEFGVGGCEIRPETGDDRFQQAARRRSADPRRPERLDRRDTVEILAGADPHGELRRPEQRVERVDVIGHQRSEEHTSELQSLMRTSYAVYCLKKKNITHLSS